MKSCNLDQTLREKQMDSHYYYCERGGFSRFCEVSGLGLIAVMVRGESGIG